MEALNLDKIICINLKSLNNAQLFAICMGYNLDFVKQLDHKKNDIIKIWIII